MKKPAVCYPVWKFSHLSDPFMASIRRILRAELEPDMESALIGSVFRMAQAENLAAYDASPRARAGKELVA